VAKWGLAVGSVLNQDEGLEMVYEKAVTLLQGSRLWLKTHDNAIWIQEFQGLAELWPSPVCSINYPVWL
jgi:hypothetical protein